LSASVGVLFENCTFSDSHIPSTFQIAALVSSAGRR